MAELAVSSQTITGASAMIKLVGDMDSGNFDVIEDELNKVLESGVLGLVVDLSGLNSLSSAGLGAIVNLARVLGERKGKLILTAIKPKIMGDLELFGLEDSLDIVESPEQAKKAVASIK